MTTSALSVVIEAAENGGLSSSCRTLSGENFDATLEIWAYRDGVFNVRMDFTQLSTVNPSLRESCKRLMASIIQTRTAGGSNTCFGVLKKFILSIPQPFDEISGIDFLNFRANQTDTRLIGTTKSLLRKWQRLGLSGLADDMEKTLDAVRIKGHPKGVAVATRDPHLGPFTDIEFQAILQALNDAYINKKIEISQFVLTWIFIATGARPVQIAALKIKDFLIREVPGGIDYSLEIPRCKQGRIIRSEFKNRALSRQIGALVADYSKALKKSLSRLFDDPNEAPLFPEKRAGDRYTTGFEYHSTPGVLGSRLGDALDCLNVISERTGKTINISPIRFRRTFGTRAAQEGHGLLIIAELLDHSDTSNAGVYIETRSEIATRLDKALALEMAPLAQAFSGKLIGGPGEATRAEDPSSHIRDLRISEAPLASCGQHSFCGLPAPLSCYTCASFEPWLDGPHEAVLEVLLSRRSQQLSQIDARIATVHDRTIVAVAQVVELCRQHKCNSFSGSSNNGE